MEQKKVREFQSFQLIKTNNEKYCFLNQETGDEC